MPPWSRSERFTLDHLFATFGYEHKRNDDEWWSIYLRLYKGNGRNHKTVYEDWQHRGVPGKSRMWPEEVDRTSKTKEQLRDQFDAYNNVRQAARDLGIRLHEVHNANFDSPSLPSKTKLPAKPSQPTARSSRSSRRDTSDEQKLQVTASQTAKGKTKNSRGTGHAVDEEESVPSEASDADSDSDKDQPVQLPGSLKRSRNDSPKETSAAKPQKKRKTHEGEDDSAPLSSEDEEATAQEQGEQGEEYDEVEAAQEGEDGEEDKEDEHTRQLKKMMDFTDLGLPEAGFPNARPSQKFKLPASKHYKEFVIWTLQQLDRILISDVSASSLPPNQRLINFFHNMFDGGISKTDIEPVVDQQLEVRSPPHYMTASTIYNILRAEFEGQTPRFTPQESFVSGTSPFSNFRLATAAFGRNLPMLHRSDIDFTGHAGGQPVIYAKMTKSKFEGNNHHHTPDDVWFVDERDPTFERGGRIYSIAVRQAECPILGEDEKHNTAEINIDVMLCREEKCGKCSGSDNGVSTGTIAFPVMHRRHLGDDNSFKQGRLGYMSDDEDIDGEIPVDPDFGFLDVKFWDGVRRGVMVCDRPNCGSCRYAFGFEP